MPTHLAESVQDRADSNQVVAAGTTPSPVVDTPKAVEPPTQTERLAYSIQEAAHLLGAAKSAIYNFE